MRGGMKRCVRGAFFVGLHYTSERNLAPISAPICGLHSGASLPLSYPFLSPCDLLRSELTIKP